MTEKKYYQGDEGHELLRMVRKLWKQLRYKDVTVDDVKHLHSIIAGGVEQGVYKRDKYGINPVIRTLHTAELITDYIAPDRSMTIAVLLYNLSRNEFVSERQIADWFGDDVAKLVHGLIKISHLYKKQAAVEDENFRKLLVAFAQDIRVVIIMIIDRFGLMREINNHPDEKFVRDMSLESRYLYAPLAHKLGLYQVKTELEDLSLKYLQRDVYNKIAAFLNETKSVRDKYIEEFSAPIKKVLEREHIKCHVKGRTKSINSIWNKVRTKKVEMNDIYDLFAIRIIIDTPLEYEKRDCWYTYSLVGDIYQANPSRLRDWITMPKSNGYESLQGTFKGKDDKWVEVQIRTERMDEVAERGLAAHWRYKGVKADGSIDRWMNNVREVLEEGSKNRMDLIRDMHTNLYDDEVFVFTPRGDVFQFPKGATVLDFAFRIHSRVGRSCIGAKVDGKNQKINYKLHSGDTVEILTSSTQVPRVDWLNIVKTSRARNKIKQALNEAQSKHAEMGRELVQRRFKNRKIEIDVATMNRFIKKKGYKATTDFYVAIGEGKIDVNSLIEEYLEFHARQQDTGKPHETAENFVLQQKNDDDDRGGDDILVIGNNVKGINYKLSRCCNPIYGDAIMGFIASDGAIKIHRRDCGNVKHLLAKYPYRIIRSQWSGKVGKQFAATLKVVGNDDIGIVSNITSLINKEGDTVLRSVSINSSGGIFEGTLVIGISSLDNLALLIKKIKNLKGVKDVQRTSH
ncbi:MAG: bifunctional (p)ppGpp synthetase/guanosine-3',5'-bis(diphosphate) 3'-pyrophosphohydrolase [Muribaculaceae bacterium]|nr:bifunctional (p)ppGpp synthetase/guanosine-3',5'-bis(diphosphate) 3'-pyrophosphohydrolase [Muribaculaceae bacterium]